MSTKVEQLSVSVQGNNSSSPGSISGPKISMFANKAGFVIPKNKLSGSLVPLFRGGKKGNFRGGKKGNSQSESEGSTKQVQRKTKWGPDLTQDTSVRKGRALAYQARVDQITQLLSSGILEVGNNEEATSAAQVQEQKLIDHRLNTKKLYELELEKREAIGEILKLNPSYKAPADYKPLLKEEKVPISIKEFPGYNFIGLIFGATSDTHKRLEKETEARVRVYGIKADTGEKVEVTSSDGTELNSVFEELYVHVSADTYEKVDAAVSLIELLLTPVSANQASISTSTAIVSDGTDKPNQIGQLAPSTPYRSTDVDLGVAQPISASAITQSHGQFHQQQGPWLASNAIQNQLHPPLGFGNHLTPSQLPVNRPPHISSPSNPSNMYQSFGGPPVISAGFGSTPPHSSLFQSTPNSQNFQRPVMPQVPQLPQGARPMNSPMLTLHSTLTPPSVANPSPLSSQQFTPLGPNQNLRPPISPVPQSAPSTAYPNQPPFRTPTPQGPNSALPLTIPQGSTAMASEPLNFSGVPQTNVSGNNYTVPPVSFPLTPSAGSIASHQTARPPFNPVLQSQVGRPPLLPSQASTPQSSLIQSNIAVQPFIPQMAMPSPSRPSVPLPSSNPLPIVSTLVTPPPQSGMPHSVSGSAPNFDPLKNPSVATRQQQPSSNDFTFQPQRQQNPQAHMIPRPGGLPAPQNVVPSQSMQLPQMPSMGLSLPNPNPPSRAPIFLRPQVTDEMNQPRASIPFDFAQNATTSQRYPTFSNPGSFSPASFPRMQPRIVNPPPPLVNSAGPFPPRANNQSQLQQNFLAPIRGPQRFVPPPSQLANNISFRPGKPTTSPSEAHQVYDPFSPSSASGNSQLEENKSKEQKQDNDPEYEDLMASVGVK